MIMAEFGYDVMNPFLYDKDEYEKVVEKLQLRGVRASEEFAILGEIKRGSFVVVYRAHDKRHDEAVAMKKERHGRRLSSSTLIEIKTLRSLPRHPNIVQFKGVAMEWRSVLVVMELLDYDLNTLRAAKRRPFSLVEIKFIMREIFKGVKFLHENGVMHRDLKPANILLGGDHHQYTQLVGRDRHQYTSQLVGEFLPVKICDFGLSARMGADSGGVGTRFYEAPEVLSYGGSYTGAVDMWSVGCMMAELALDKPLFRGRSDAVQLAFIRLLLCEKCDHLQLWMGTNAAFSGATDLTPPGLHLLERLLAYDPSKRISAAEALNHPWFKQDPLPPN